LTSAQELLRTFNSSPNNELVWRQTGCRFELAREMIRAEMDEFGNLTLTIPAARPSTEEGRS